MNDYSQAKAPRQIRRPPLQRMTRQFQIIWIVGMAAALAYSIYSTVAESGLAAYIMQLELRIAGAAAMKITLLVTLFVLLAPLVAITAIVAKIAPSQVWMGAESRNRSTLGPFERLNRPLQVQHISWKVVFVVTAVPLVVGAVVSPILHYLDQRDQQEKVYSIDLKWDVTPPPPGTRFVEVTGLMARSHALIFKRTLNGSDSYEVFAPITNYRWTPADPVRYIVRQESPVSDGQAQWPEVFRERGVAQISGKISHSLPAFVASEFRSKGLKLGPSYTVIDWQELPDHRVPYSGDATVAAVICLIIAGWALLMMVVVKFMLPMVIRKKQIAYSAGRNPSSLRG
jgi:hypothetical protein